MTDRYAGPLPTADDAPDMVTDGLAVMFDRAALARLLDDARGLESTSRTPQA